jgi:peroxiredoxin
MTPTSMPRAPALPAFLSALSLALGLAFSAGNAHAAATVGQPAPAFSAVDTQGKTVTLAELKGKTVVLEWLNPGCPFVLKHYRSGNMQGTQKEAVAQGVVWLSVNSTSTDAQDYQPPAALAQWMQAQKASASQTLMDSDGKIGRSYDARTTPHLYVENAAGTLEYAGAIDSKASANPADVAGATNYVKSALAETLAGKPVSTPTTRPYGCSVKYAPAA